jgi:hypothetical protein
MSGCVAKMRRKTKSFFMSAKAMTYLAGDAPSMQAWATLHVSGRGLEARGPARLNPSGRGARRTPNEWRASEQRADVRTRGRSNDGAHRSSTLTSGHKVVRTLARVGAAR